MKNLILLTFLFSQSVSAQQVTDQQMREMTEKMQSQIQQQNAPQMPQMPQVPQPQTEAPKASSESTLDMTMAMAACKGKMRGMPCSINAGGRNRTPGVCYAESRKLPLFCRPSNHPNPREIILKEKEPRGKK